jgi:hypothetical protein
VTREFKTQVGPKARRAEEARLARLCKSIHKHKAGLDFAVEESFGGGLDAQVWRTAFESSDPHDTIRTMAVTDSYSAIVNASVEILKAVAGNRLIGLLPHRRPHAEQVFAAVQTDGGLIKKQVNLLNGCYVLEGRLEHASPDVSPEEVRKAVERLRTGLPELIATVIAWLKAYGVLTGDDSVRPQSSAAQ